MYGMPDSVIVGSAKRFGRMTKVREYDRHESIVEWATRKLDDWFPTPPAEGIKEARQEFFETHGYYPPGDPRE